MRNIKALAVMAAQRVPVFAPDRTTVLAYVNRQTTSVGAAKAGGGASAQRERIDGRWGWVITRAASQ
jgi:hypothetical protein